MVLPWVPVIDTVAQGRISSASISARRMMGRPRSLAASNSGLPALTALEMTRWPAPLTLSGSWPIRHGDAAGAQALEIGAVLQVAALDVIATRVHHLGNGAHADAADADDMEQACLIWIGKMHA